MPSLRSAGSHPLAVSQHDARNQMREYAITWLINSVFPPVRQSTLRKRVKLASRFPNFANRSGVKRLCRLNFGFRARFLDIPPLGVTAGIIARSSVVRRMNDWIWLVGCLWIVDDWRRRRLGLPVPAKRFFPRRPSAFWPSPMLIPWTSIGRRPRSGSSWTARSWSPSARIYASRCKSIGRTCGSVSD